MQQKQSAAGTGRVGVAILGFGYWGPNLARNTLLSPEASLRAICDRRSERLELARSLYPGVSVTEHYADLLEDSAVDLIVVATPVSTHFALAMAAIQAGKHVLIEKPMTASSTEAELLLAAAKEH